MHSSSRRSRPTIIAVAEGFGFGPTSKLLAVVRALDALTSADWVFVSEGPGADLMELDGRSPIRASPGSATALPPASLAIVAGSPDWAQRLSSTMPVYFIDSLGFMWTEADEADLVPVRTGIRGYFAQNLFDSVDNLARLGVGQVVAVSGIVERSEPEPTADVPDVVLSLGGVVNPFTDASTQAYFDLASDVTQARIDRGERVRVLFSPSAAARFDWRAGGEVGPATTAETRFLLANSKRVAGSPGLTTLVEATRSEVGLVPLPAQNWSQAMICRQIAQAGVPGLWPVLEQAYRAIPGSLGERAGLAAVNAVNADLLRDRELRSLIIDAIDGPAAGLPAALLGAPFTGAQECAHLVADDAGLT